MGMCVFSWQFTFNQTKVAAMNTARKLLTMWVIIAAMCSNSGCADDTNSTSTSNQGKANAEQAKLPFTISKETTYFTEPLDEAGYVDYLGALNKLCHEGVMPENNAAGALVGGHWSKRHHHRA
jgi:hypothetical protein